MSVSRRGLLGLGAAVAVSVAASACSDAPEKTGRASTPSRRPEPGSVTSERPVGPRFPGRPAPGSLYYGASVPHHRSLPAWEEELGSALALNRSYFTPDPNETAQLIRRCHDDLANRRLPHVSIKPAGTWRDIGAGARTTGSPACSAHWERSPPRSSSPSTTSPRTTPAPRACSRPTSWRCRSGHRDRRRGGAAGHDRSRPPALDLRSVARRRRPVGVAGSGGIRDRPRHLQPLVADQRQGVAQLRSKADEVIGWFGDTPLAIGEYGCRRTRRTPGSRRVAPRRGPLREDPQHRLDVVLQLRRGLTGGLVDAPGRDRADLRRAARLRLGGPRPAPGRPRSGG